MPALPATPRRFCNQTVHNFRHLVKSARIRQRIRHRQYDMSAHAMEEMAEDGLDIVDVEHAVLHGEITRIERDDPRGTKYVIEGMAANEPQFVGVVGRFVETGRYLVITVYALRNNHEDF